MDRLPSPPPETENENVHVSSDVIGSTVYSQRFVLKTLLEILKESDAAKQTDGDNTQVSELDLNLEDRLCILWDMSVDKEVSKFLNEQNAFEIIENVIQATNKPRLTEILMGIVANMLCNESLIENFTENEKLCDLILNMCGCRDSPTLVETMRCLRISLENAIWSNIWEEKFIALNIWDDLFFIAKSATNENLMLQVAQCVDCLLDKTETARNFLEKQNSVEQFTDIIDNCLSDDNEEICSYWLHGFQNLSSLETLTVLFRESNWDQIVTVLIKILTHLQSKIGDDEGLLEMMSNSSCLINLACSLSLINWNFEKTQLNESIIETLDKLEPKFPLKVDGDQQNQYCEIANKQFMEIMKKLNSNEVK